LIPSVSTRGELDEFEQQNIEEAVLWLMRKSLKSETIFTEGFIRDLHKRMYGNVWEWAGKFRKSNKNLGIDKWQIPAALKTLCDDALFWVKNGTCPPDEITVRFKHRIVSIHCFVNGNGRHSRLMADIIIEKVFKMPLYTWGAAWLVQQAEARSRYLEAVRAADQGDMSLLFQFAKSQIVNHISTVSLIYVKKPPTIL